MSSSKTLRPKAGDLLVLIDMESMMNDPLWHPGHPCYWGRYQLVLEKKGGKYHFYDLEKGHTHVCVHADFFDIFDIAK